MDRSHDDVPSQTRANAWILVGTDHISSSCAWQALSSAITCDYGQAQCLVLDWYGLLDFLVKIVGTHSHALQQVVIGALLVIQCRSGRKWLMKGFDRVVVVIGWVQIWLWCFCQHVVAGG